MLGRQHDQHHVHRRFRRQLPIDAAQHHRRADPGHGNRGRRNGQLRIFDFVHGHTTERGQREERHLGDLFQRTHDTDRKCVGQTFRDHAHTDPDSDAYPNSDPDPDTNSDSDANPHAYTHPVVDADANPDSYADADANPDSFAYANPDSFAYANPDAYVDSDSDADTNRDTYTNLDTLGGPDVNCPTPSAPWYWAATDRAGRRTEPGLARCAGGRNPPHPPPPLADRSERVARPRALTSLPSLLGWVFHRA